MKGIILAAGYATRLYPLTLDRPKALLPVGDRVVLDYIISEIETIDEIDEIFLISNHKFYEHFIEWKEGRKSNKKIKVIDDGTTSDETKLGAIGDMELAVMQENIKDDVLIIAGDNLFTYRLKDFYNFFNNLKKDCIIVKQLSDENDLKRMGVVLADNNSKVLEFEEKPQHPKSNMAAFGAYIYLRDTLPMIGEYIEEGNIPDAPGYFPGWLYKRKDIYAYEFNGECYDIGTHESYNEVHEKFLKGV